MARLDDASTLATVRGSVGGLVVSSNDQGFYVRPDRAPLTPRTYGQSQQRFLFSRLGIAWRALSSSDRTSWQTQAADPLWGRLDWFGNPYGIGPYGLFVAVNYPLALSGSALVSTAPDPVFPAAVAIDSATLTRSGFSASGAVTFTAALPAAAPLLQVSLAPSVNSSSGLRKWRRILDSLAAHGAADSVSLWVGAADRFGLPLVGQTWTVFARVFDSSGRPSAWDDFPVTVGVP